jgi:hypothetical protein
MNVRGRNEEGKHIFTWKRSRRKDERDEKERDGQKEREEKRNKRVNIREREKKRRTKKVELPHHLITLRLLSIINSFESLGGENKRTTLCPCIAFLLKTR